MLIDPVGDHPARLRAGVYPLCHLPEGAVTISLFPYRNDYKIIAWCRTGREWPEIGRCQFGPGNIGMGGLWGLYVEPRWRRKGIGEALLRCRLQLLRYLGQHTAQLEVLVENATAIRLNERVRGYGGPHNKSDKRLYRFDLTHLSTKPPA